MDNQTIIKMLRDSLRANTIHTFLDKALQHNDLFMDPVVQDYFMDWAKGVVKEHVYKAALEHPFNVQTWNLILRFGGAQLKTLEVADLVKPSYASSWMQTTSTYHISSDTSIRVITKHSEDHVVRVVYTYKYHADYSFCRGFKFDFNNPQRGWVMNKNTREEHLADLSVKVKEQVLEDLGFLFGAGVKVK